MFSDTLWVPDTTVGRRTREIMQNDKYKRGMNMKKNVASSLLLIGLLLIAHLSCSRKDALEGGKVFREITPGEVKERLANGDDLVILDVRTKEEYESDTGHLDGAILIPIQELEKRYHELDALKDREIVAYCHSGRRSERASKFLGEKGFKVYNMVGGIVEWNKVKGDTLKVK